MQKTEGKRTVIVIDEDGKNLESTYPKRAKGLIKAGRARYVDENTIMLLSCPLEEYILEENKMNDNIKLEETTKNEEITLVYIMNKIDEIIMMNKEALLKDFGDVSVVPGTKNPVQAICETNNKLIDFLKDIYKSLKGENEMDSKILDTLKELLNNAISLSEEDIASDILSQIVSLRSNK